MPQGVHFFFISRNWKTKRKYHHWYKPYLH